MDGGVEVLGAVGDVDEELMGGDWFARDFDGGGGLAGWRKPRRGRRVVRSVVFC